MKVDKERSGVLEPLRVQMEPAAREEAAGSEQKGRAQSPLFEKDTRFRTMKGLSAGWSWSRRGFGL